MEALRTSPQISGCFDAIYVINLPSRKDRRDEMEAQLSEVGLSLSSDRVVLFPAVRPADAGPFPTIGARGCFMSHLTVLEDAFSKGLSNILILEDDCNFSSDWSARLASFSLACQSLNWGVFYGGTCSVLEVVEPVADGFSIVSGDTALMGSHCLGVNGSAVPVLVKYLREILSRPPGDPAGGPMHVDGAYSWFRRSHPEFVTLLATPEIAYQRLSRTDVHTLRWYDKSPLVSSAVNLLRKIRNHV